MRDVSFWGDLLVRPIMEQVKNKFPDIKWDDDKLIPMGLCSRISVFGKIEDKIVMVCFIPSDIMGGVISYDTGKRKRGYSKDSIGAWNGMDKISEIITDIEQIYSLIEKQL